MLDLAAEYQAGAPDLRLGEELHHKAPTIRCAQIARVPCGLAAAWDAASWPRRPGGCSPPAATPSGGT